MKRKVKPVALGTGVNKRQKTRSLPMPTKVTFGKPIRKAMTLEALVHRLLCPDEYVGIPSALPDYAEIKDFKIEGLAKEFFIEYTLVKVSRHRSNPEEDRTVLIEL